MQIAIVLFGLIALAASLPVPDAPLLPGNQISVLKQEEVRDEHGQFALSFLTANGIAVADSGKLVLNADRTAATIAREGAYAYRTDDGRTLTVRYVADENGYRATGDHLPTPPPALN